MKEELEELLKDDEHRALRAINVRVHNLGWLYSDRKNFASFCTILQGLPSQVYASEFVECLLDQYWDDTQWHIVKYYFIPNTIFATVTILFFQVAL